jgi:hypothetical protein
MTLTNIVTLQLSNIVGLRASTYARVEETGQRRHRTYLGTLIQDVFARQRALHRPVRSPARSEPERVQTGLRLERKMLKVLKALAEYLDLTLAEVVEIIVLQAFESEPGFSGGTLRRIEQLKRVYEMEYGLSDVRLRLFRK